MYTTFCIFGFYILLERVMKNYTWSDQPWWKLRGFMWLLIIVCLGEWIGWVFPSSPFSHPLVDLSEWGLLGGLVAFFIYEVIIYIIHRAQHKIPILWHMHQWHHSSERLDIWSTYRAHPLEVPIFHLASVLVFSWLFNLSDFVAIWMGTFITAIQVFEHANVKTPRWLGYIIARPENHMLHHAREKHHSNYADLPIVDMLFGTFEAPEKAPHEVGFWDGASRLIGKQFWCQPIDDERPLTTPSENVSNSI